MRTLLACASLLLLCSPAFPQGAKKNPFVVIDTSHGVIEVELLPAFAPETVKNFLRYVDDQFYQGMIFHRVIPKFMIQGGGFDRTMKEKKATHPPIRNEAGHDNGLLNKRGFVSMARTSDPDTATCQFYINVADNPHLDKMDKTGWCVFGKVVKGMEVADAITKVKTTSMAGHNDVPEEPVVIRKIERKR